MCGVVWIYDIWCLIYSSRDDHILTHITPCGCRPVKEAFKAVVQENQERAFARSSPKEISDQLPDEQKIEANNFQMNKSVQKEDDMTPYVRKALTDGEVKREVRQW